MADNKVAVEITLEEKAALQALTQLTREIQKTEDGFKSLGNNGDKSVKKVDKSTQELLGTFQMASIPFKKIEGQATFSLRKVEDSFKSLETKSSESLSTMGGFTKGIAGGFTSLVGGVTIANLASQAIIGTANAIKSFVLNSVNAASEQENAINRMNQALRSTGDYSKAAADDFLSFASDMQANSKFGDEVVLGQLAIAKSMGATNEQAKQLVQAAANLSGQLGGSLEERVMQLGKTLTGTSGRLGQMVPGFKNLTEEQLKAGKAFEFVNSQYKGAAANELKTHEGLVTSTTNAYSDMEEELGTLISKNGLTVTSVGAVKGTFQLFTSALHDLNVELGLVDRTQAEAVAKANELSAEYADLTDKAARYRKASTGDTSDFNWFERIGLSAKFAGVQADLYEGKQKRILNDINSLLPEEVAPTGNKVDKGISPEDQKRIDSYRTAQSTINEIKAQAQIAQEEQDALLAAQAIGKNELEIQQIYEFEALKLEAQMTAEEEKAMVIKDAKERTLKLQEVSAKRELEFTKLSNAQLKAENAKKVEDEKRTNDLVLGSTATLLQESASLAKDGSIAQKALQITAATINSYVAFSNALADTRPAAAAPFVAASVLAVGLANVSRIAGAKFAQGGIVPGNSVAGDRIPAHLNSREMVLNMGQQAELYSIAKGQGGGSSGNIEALLERLINAIEKQPIQFVVDGRVLATSVRKEVQSGFRLT